MHIRKINECRDFEDEGEEASKIFHFLRSCRNWIEGIEIETQKNEIQQILSIDCYLLHYSERLDEHPRNYWYLDKDGCATDNRLPPPIRSDDENGALTPTNNSTTTVIHPPTNGNTNTNINHMINNNSQETQVVKKVIDQSHIVSPSPPQSPPPSPSSPAIQ
ncbi:unnamed protein product [Orchesella dallaii]|uniref:Uncharacterized protein n=1 Tax=Orchesella dallaii TaxID=48710 RepID=A0ABP1RXT3_9HEXA